VSANIEQILEQRGNQYGEFTEHARVTQNIKRAMEDSEHWVELSDDKREALEMIAHKIGRILTGNPEYKDSWTDIIGYARLVEKTLPDEVKA
jgi:hypothetical protein